MKVSLFICLLMHVDEVRYNWYEWSGSKESETLIIVCSRLSHNLQVTMFISHIMLNSYLLRDFNELFLRCLTIFLSASFYKRAKFSNTHSQFFL